MLRSCSSLSLISAISTAVLPPIALWISRPVVRLIESLAEAKTFDEWIDDAAFENIPPIPDEDFSFELVWPPIPKPQLSEDIP